MSIADHISTLFKQDIQAAIEEVLLVEPGTASIMTDAVYKKIQAVWGGEKVYIQAVNNSTRNEKIKTELIQAALDGEPEQPYMAADSYSE